MDADRIKRFAGALIALVAFALLVRGIYVWGGILLLLSFVFIYVKGLGKANDRNVYENRIKSNLTVDEIYEKIKDVQTSLGKPQIDDQNGSNGISIVIGPDKYKNCIIISKENESIIVRHENQEASEIANFGPKEYSDFASTNIIIVQLIRAIRSFIERLSLNENESFDINLNDYNLYYRNSSEGYYKDPNGNNILGIESAYNPFVARVLDEEWTEMASIRPVATNTLGAIVESKGYNIFANLEVYGQLKKTEYGGQETYFAETDGGNFEIKIFPAGTKAGITSNYTITQDGELRAIVAYSRNLELSSTGTCDNELIISYDDDYLVLYAAIETFISTLSSKYKS